MFKRTAIATLTLAGTLALTLQTFGAAPARTPELAQKQYNTVISQLDTGGDLLIFANVDGLLEETFTGITKMIDLVPAQDTESKSIKDILAKLPGFLKTQGFYAVEGIGISSVPRSDGQYTTKTFISRKKSAAEKPLWRSIVGLKPYRLAGLDFLPADTVMAQATANDLKQTWAIVKTGINQLGTPKTIESFNQGITIGSTVIGQDIEKLIATIGEENFISIQLSTTATVDIPLSTNQTMTIPAPTILLGIAVTDNTLATVLEKSITQNELPLQKTTVSGTVINTLNLPLPSPVPVALTFATHENMLLIGSTQKVVTDAIMAYTQKNGLASSAEFKKAFDGLPLVNNGLDYVSKRFTETVADIQSKTMASSMANLDQKNLEMVNNMMKMQGFGPSAAVIINFDRGVLSHCIGAYGGRKLVAGAAAAPAGMLAAIAIPSFVKARTTSKKNACINNLRRIDVAKDLAAMDNNWGKGQAINPGSPEEAKVMDYIKGRAIPTCPCGGTYTINPIGTMPACSNPEHNLEQ
jgi:hypothetical protein